MSQDDSARPDPERPLPCPPPLRRERLPSSQPKPRQDDPGAPERLRRLLQSPNYRRADRDYDFLERDELRATRLQLEFLKVELLLQEFGVCGTIVVFGGTRIPEPAAARRRVEAARAAMARRPGDEAARRELVVAERVLDKSRYYEVAREFGRLVGCFGAGPQDGRLTLATGGGPGLMEAANRGADDVGARSIGYNITLPTEQFPNPYITPGLCFQFRYFALRKMHFLLRARALVAFPGGYGTLDELFETLCLVQTRTIEPLPIVLVGEAWWRRVFDAAFLVSEGVIAPEDAELFGYADTAPAIWSGIQGWYREAGRPLLP